MSDATIVKSLDHYVNMPMQYTEIFLKRKKKKISLDFFFFFECFRSKHTLWVQVLSTYGVCKKIRYTPANPFFLYIKVGFKGVYIA